jgi:hypothetical protein
MRIVIVTSILLLLIVSEASATNLAVCKTMPDLAAARLRWSNTRGAENWGSDKACYAYRTQFYEAVLARQTAAICKIGTEKQNVLQILDAEIESFNESIASHCGMIDQE